MRRKESQKSGHLSKTIQQVWRKAKEKNVTNRMSQPKKWHYLFVTHISEHPLWGALKEETAFASQ